MKSHTSEYLYVFKYSWAGKFGSFRSNTRTKHFCPKFPVSFDISPDPHIYVSHCDYLKHTAVPWSHISSWSLKVTSRATSLFGEQLNVHGVECFKTPLSKPNDICHTNLIISSTELIFSERSRKNTFRDLLIEGLNISGVLCVRIRGPLHVTTDISCSSTAARNMRVTALTAAVTTAIASSLHYLNW